MSQISLRVNMFLWCFAYVLVATLPLKSVSEHGLNISLQRFERSVKILPSHKELTSHDSLFLSSEEKFVAKHLWNSKKYNVLTSFEYFKNEANTRDYFNDLDLRMYKGYILPDQQDLRYLQSTGKKLNKYITIVDTDITTLVKDGWKHHSKNKDGDLYLTNKEYTMTHFEREFVDGNLVQKGTKLKAKLILGLDSNGQVVHLDRPYIPKNKNSKPPNYEILATFDKEYLSKQKINRNKIRQGMKKELADIRRAVLLNENNPKFKKLAKSCITSNRGRRSLPVGGSGCAIMMKPNNDVDYINPKDFVEAYKKADDNEKRILADIAAKHKNKIVSNGLDTDIEKKTMNNLLELEQTKSHVKNINKIDDAFSVSKPGSKKPVGSSILFGTTQSLAEVNSKVKVSYNKAVKSISRHKAAKAVANGISKANSFLSIFFAAKTIVNGINHNDTTSLAILGGQFGFNGLTNIVVTAGTKYSNHIVKNLNKAIAAKDFGKIAKYGKAMNTASKVGKSVKVIGEVAGVIGAVADIGLSTWSMTKSLERLLNATNKYERNAAIADIVSDAIDIAVTEIVTIGSLAFPPAAPFLIAGGIVINILTQLTVGLFKAANEVARINSEVPLLDSEKQEVFKSRFFDWFGTRKPDYIDNLVDEKIANDIAVQLSLEFLKNNNDIFEIVVPSRTLFYEGACRLTNQYCAYKNAWGCMAGQWEDEFTVANGCDYGRPCGKKYEICGDYYINHGNWGYNQKRCKCDGRAETTFGLPRQNSLVDFRNKQKIYWERSVPKDVENAEFQCKPGSKSNIDYKLIQSNSREDYLCENAIGLLQPHYRRRQGQAMLFVLEDGNDKVYLNPHDTKPNLFLMGNDGSKEFYGGGGSDDFIFDSNCTMSLKGFIEGKNGEDGITFGDTCAKDKKITVDFFQGKIRSENNNLDLSFYGIENINGRKNQGETFNVTCDTRRVSGNGGSSTNFDEILIKSQCSQYNLTIFGSSYTNIVSVLTGGIISIVFDDSWTNSKVDLTVFPGSSQNLFFLNNTSSQLSKVSTTKVKNQLIVDLATSALNQIKLIITMELGAKSFITRFSENPDGSPDSVLLFSMKNEPTALFFHSLPDFGQAPNNNFPTRTGCRVTENVFEISGSSLWHVYGGDLNDEFILHTNRFGKIIGNDGIDSISIGEKLSVPVNLQLGSEKLKSIENVYGVPGVPLTVRTFCDTLLVATRGGSNTTYDLVTIPREIRCHNRSLRIFIEGHVHVVLEERRRQDNDTVQIITSENKGLKFELETRATEIGNTLVAIPTSSKNWTVINSRLINHQIIVNLKKNGKEDRIKFNLKFVEHSKNEQYLRSPYIQIFDPNSNHTPGVVLFERSSGTPKIIYDLRNMQNETVVEGFVGIKHLFVLVTSQNLWSVTGGNASDEFILQVKTHDYYKPNKMNWNVKGGTASDEFILQDKTHDYYKPHKIIGGGGVNTLILERGEENKNISATYVVNLYKKQFGFLNRHDEINRYHIIGIIDSIQNVIGRPESPDIFRASCSTRSFNGQGGRRDGNENDLIKITDEVCNYNLLIIVPEYTTVINTARKGDFNYYITNFTTSTLDIMPTYQNRHSLKFLFHSWEIIKAVGFNGSTWELGLKLSNDHQKEVVHAFYLWAPPQSSEFVNPVFEFSPAGSLVSTDIRVNTEGVTMATFLVEGLTDTENVYGLPVDLNRFLINITSGFTESSGEIHGCSDGLRCSANQFWIFNLDSSLKVLDGGNCQENDCTNYLFFPTNSNERKLHFDLDIRMGRVITEDGEIVISHLRNIHEFHGSKGISANVTCSTKQVSNLDVVIITQADCQSDLVIGVEEYTRVIFQKIGNDDMNITAIEREMTELFMVNDEDDEDNDYENYEYEDSEMDKLGDDKLKNEFNSTLNETEYDTNITIFNRTVHYRFARPMTFDPEGDFNEMLSVDHIYHLPFELETLENIDFNSTEKRLYYTIDGVEYYHSMISPLYFWEQFYSQPSFLTEDGYSIQVARDGSLWVTLGNASNEVTQESLPDLMEIAIQLEITLLIQTMNSFYFMGHSGKKNDDRNVVQNSPEKTSHLAGGGANDTIYDILSLDNDVFIYTGYDEDSYIDWDRTKKQTVDLTDIVVPIRNISGTKFVPETTTIGNNLVISMQGYENYFPGKITIVNGALPWVAKRIQLLLNGALMDFVSNEGNDTSLNEETTMQNFNSRNRRSLEPPDSNKRIWTIGPRPLVIPRDVSIYTISTEDLEDGQEISLESNGEGQEGQKFQMVRNGSDLYMTNAASSNVTDVKAIIINDFWENNELKDDTFNDWNKDTRTISGVTVSLPGLKVKLNGTNVISEYTGNFFSADEVSKKPIKITVIKPWKQALFEFEEILLENMPDISRTFYCEECLPWWKQTTKLVIVIIGILTIFLIIFVSFMILNEQRKGYYAVVVTNVNCDDTPNMEMMKLKQ